MKDFLIHVLRATAVILVAFALASSARAQQADEDPVPDTPRHPQSAATPQSPQSHDASALPSGEAQTQDVLTFISRVAKEQGQLVLNDPVTKMYCQFADQKKAKPFVGKQVKVTGKLENEDKHDSYRKHRTAVVIV